MANPLFNVLSGGMPAMSGPMGQFGQMMQQFQQFKASFRATPKQRCRSSCNQAKCHKTN